MDIFQRKESRYWYYWFRVNGKLYKGSTGIPKEYPKEARRILAQKYEEAMRHRVLKEKPDITIADAYDRICVVGKDKAKSTLDQYKAAKAKLLGLGRYGTANGFWCLPASVTLMSQIEDEHVEDLVAARRAEGLKNNSINGELRVLKRAIEANRRRYRVNEDLDIALLSGFAKTRFLTDPEINQVVLALEAKKGHPAYDKAADLFTFLLNTGMRLSEALSIEWPDVDLTAHRIEVYRIKTDSLSYIPISDELAEVLKRRSNLPRPFDGMNRAVRLLRVVISETCNASERIAAQRGRATVHTLRDTYASRLVQSGMTLKAVADLLGHTTVTQTQKYAHLESSATADQARQIMNARRAG